MDATAAEVLCLADADRDGMVDTHELDLFLTQLDGGGLEADAFDDESFVTVIMARQGSPLRV